MASGGNKKVANSLVSLSSAAIVAVYAAGFLRTRAAAEKMDEASNGRRPSSPAPPEAGERHPSAPIEPPAGHAPAPTDLRSPAVAADARDAHDAKPSAATATTADAKPADAALKNDSKPATATTAPEPMSAPAPAAAAPSNQPEAHAADAKSEAKGDAPTNLLMPKEKYKDGTFLGWGTCRHGDIQAQVVIQDGRITSASIAQCWTRYSCSWVSHLPGQVVSRQSPDVDYVTGATQSANAFYWAIIDALSKAKAPVVRETPAPQRGAKH